MMQFASRTQTFPRNQISKKHHCSTMRLVLGLNLLNLCVTGMAVSIDCRDVVADSCTDFCLSPMGNHVELGWYGIDCPQSFCDIAALASDALASTGVADFAKFHGNRLRALPDFSVCDGFVCGEIYGCKHSENTVDVLCYDFDADHYGQACVSPDGLQIFSSYMIFASYVVPDYSQAGTSCEVSKFGEVSVTFTRDVTIMKAAADFPYCKDRTAEVALASDVTSLASHLGQASAAGAQVQAADGAQVQAATKAATIGLVVAAVLFLMAMIYTV